MRLLCTSFRLPFFAWRSFSGRPSRLLLGFGILLVMASLAATAMVIWNKRSNALADVERDFRRISLILSEQTARTLQTIDLVLIQTAVELSVQMPTSGAGTINQMLHSRISGIPAVRSLAVFDASGSPMNSSRKLAATGDSSLGASLGAMLGSALSSAFSGFTIFSDGTSTSSPPATAASIHPVSEPPPGLIIGVPAPDSVERVFTLSRRIDDSQGRYQGMAVASIDAGYFENLYQEIGMDEGAEVLLLRRDFHLLARHPHVGSADAARRLRAQIFFLSLAGADGSGSGQHVEAPDDAPRIVAVRSLRDHPLFLAISIPEAMALTRWRKESIRLLLGVLGESTLIMLLIGFLTRQMAQREAGETALREANRALAESDERLRLILESSTDGFWDWNIESDVAVWSERWFELLGYQPGQIGSNMAALQSVVHPDDVAKLSSTLRAHVVEGRPYQCEIRLRRANGQYVWVLSRGRALRDAQGRAYRMVGANADITVRKRLELAQAAAARRVESTAIRTHSVLEAIADGLVVVDDHGRIEDFNPAAQAIFGHKREDVIGQPVSLLLPEPIPGENGGAVSDCLRRGAILNHNSHETIGRRRDGAHFPVEIAFNSMIINRDETGAVIEDRVLFVGSIRDITERKRIEAELLAAKSQAEVANRAKSEFLAHMSHELRTPLNAIIGFSEIIIHQMLGPAGVPKYVEYAGDIRDSGNHLLHVIGDILDMSKIEAGRYELHEEVMNPQPLLTSCLTMVSGRAAAAGVLLASRFDAPLPHLRVDALALKQIALNLLSNAVKFTSRGGKVTLEAGVMTDGRFQISVIDTGIGIPPNKFETIFMPFRQANAALARKREGTGLGLSIVKSFVEMHGGTVHVESVVNQGSTLTVRLPAERIII
ncbi:two-component system, cell cycle sensor histidine kinase PleC [Azospirillaceae bacterium]